MPPVEDHEVHSRVKRGSDHRYGCHNRPRPAQGAWVASAKAYGGGHKFRMSSECRYDQSLSDTRCCGCKHRGSGEAYDQKIRENGK